MSSSIKLKNANGKTVSVTNSNANQTDKEIIYLNTVDELANASGSTNAVAIVSDLNRGGTFIWSATGTANGGTVFAGVSGYWNRQYSGAVNVKWFGAKGDGITDDTLALKSALEYISSYSKTLVFNTSMVIAINNSTYPDLLNKCVILGNGATLKLIGNVYSIFNVKASSVVINGFNIDGNNKSLSRVVDIQGDNYTDIIIRNITAENILRNDTTSNGTFSAINITGKSCSNFIIENIHCRNIKVLGDGIVGDSSRDVRVVKVYGYGGSTFHNSSINNISSDGMCNIDGNGDEIYEDSDTVHIIIDETYRLINCNSTISNVFSTNGAKRSVKLQASGFVVSNIGMDAGVFSDGAYKAWSVLSVYGNNVSASSITARGGVHRAVDIKGNNISVVGISSSNILNLTNYSDIRYINAVIGIVSGATNVSVSGVSCSSNNIALLSCYTEDEKIKNIAISNVSGKASSMGVIGSSLSLSCYNISLSNINLDVVNSTAFYTLLCSYIERLNLKGITLNIDDDITRLYQVDNVNNIIIADNSFIKIGVALSDYMFALNDVSNVNINNVNADNITKGVRVINGNCIGVNGLYSKTIASGNGVDLRGTTTASNITNIYGFTTSLYTLNTATKVTLSNFDGLITWYASDKAANLTTLQKNNAITNATSGQELAKINEIILLLRASGIINT